MSTTAKAQATTRFEEESKQIAAAITTLGLLMPEGMAVTVSRSRGGAAIANVYYPDGSIVTKTFCGGSVH